MHLPTPLSLGLTLLLTTTTTVLASPVTEQSPNPNTAPNNKRFTLGGSLGNIIYGNNDQCTSPSQINLKGDPGILESVEGGSSLGGFHCGWKLWVACVGLAGGACWEPCAAGGFVDPLCDACIAAMGGLGCAACVHDTALQESTNEFYVKNQDKIVAKMQSDFCEVPKANVPRLQEFAAKESGTPSYSGEAPATA